MESVIEQKAHTYKMVVLGHYSVGKSSIILNFVKGEFNPNEESTIGASFLTKTIFNGKDAIKYEIWDTAGQERYYSLIPMYYRGAHVALVVYDVTSQKSFVNAKKWIEELKQDKPDGFLKILVANKIDLEDDIVVTKEEGKEYADKERLLFFETSAKTGSGIESLFSNISSILPREVKKLDDIGKKLKKPKGTFFCC